MFRNNNISVLQAGFKTLIDVNSPASLLKRHILLLAFLHRRSVIPAGNEAGLTLLVEAVVDWDLVEAGSGDELFEVGDGVCFFEAVGEERI